MKRLSATDAMLLLQESPENDYTHSIRITILEPAQGASEVDARDVAEALARALHRIPLLTWKLAPTPLGLRHPMWVTDPDLEVSSHLHRVGCPRPGTERELADLVSDFAGRPLRRDRPLWEAWIVDGLSDGRVATITKIHHALADGVATVALFHQAHTLEPRPLPRVPPSASDPLTSVPSSRLARLSLAMRKAPADKPTARDVLRKHREARRELQRRGLRHTAARGTDAPACPLNRPPGPNRRFAAASFPLAGVKIIGRAHGCSVNDVFLAMCATALRRYLVERGELPTRPLVASVPVSTRTAGDMAGYGNRLGTLSVTLATDIDDPAARLAAIKASVDSAKARFEATQGARADDVLEILPAPVHRLLARAVRARIKSGRPVVGNVGLSNVPGPRQPLYLGEAKVSAVYGIGPVIGGLGLNITAWSYVDQFNVSFLSGRGAVPEVWPLVTHFQEAFEQMRLATAGQGPVLEAREAGATHD